MTLRITILDGPGAGQAFEFGNDAEKIEIGRDSDHCQVVFPPDFTAVGRRHLGIRRSLGSYKLEVKVRNPVLLDGREPFDDEPLGPSQEIQLGRKGPRLKIETEFEEGLPLTDPGEAMSTPSHIALTQRKTSHRIKAALAGLAVVVVAAFGIFYWQQEEARQQVLALVEQGQTVQSVDQLSTEMLQHVAASTYLVLIADSLGEDPVGTAWVAGNGVLATNAHVAEVFHTLTPGQRLVVRATTPPHPTSTIESVDLHPDYARFWQVWERFLPVRTVSDGGLTVVDQPGPGYDVALMYTVAGDSLNEPLEIADDEALALLAAGDAIAYVGFPMERLAGGGVHPSAPIPQVQRGHVTAITDYFLLPGDPAERNLIQHSLPITGGASGSPVVDASGRVVAVINAMNIDILESGMRAPSAAGVNFAQRATLVTELIEDRVAERAEARQAAWAAGFATFDDPAVSVPLAILADWSGSVGGEPIEVAHHQGVLEGQDAPELYVTRFQGIISEPGEYLAVAVSRGRHDINMLLTQGDTVLARDLAYDWFPMLTHEHRGRRAALDIVIFAENLPEAPDFELMIWRIGGGQGQRGS